jgi:hypothetical protein
MDLFSVSIATNCGKRTHGGRSPDADHFLFGMLVTFSHAICVTGDEQTSFSVIFFSNF